MQEGETFWSVGRSSVGTAEGRGADGGLLVSVGGLTTGVGAFETGSEGTATESAGDGADGTGTSGSERSMDESDESGAFTGGGRIVAGASLFNGVEGN